MTDVTAGAFQNVDPAIAEVWARRAAELARPRLDDDPGHSRAMLLVARVAGEVYAFDARYVFDIRPTGTITRVPRVPAWVAGVTAIRGRILSVIDLAAYFELCAPGAACSPGETCARSSQHMVLVATPDMELCLLVDEVLAVAPFALDSLKDAGGSLQGLPAEYVRGVVVGTASAAAPWGRGMLVVLDLPALLSDRRIVINQEIVPVAPQPGCSAVEERMNQ